MNEIGGLTKNLAEAFNSVRVALKAKEDHATVVIVGTDLDWVGARHHGGDRVLNRRNSVLQAASAQAKMCELGVERRDLLLALSKYIDGSPQHHYTVHRLLSGEEQICKVTGNDLHPAQVVSAMLVKELHAVENLSCGV